MMSLVKWTSSIIQKSTGALQSRMEAIAKLGSDAAFAAQNTFSAWKHGPDAPDSGREHIQDGFDDLLSKDSAYLINQAAQPLRLAPETGTGFSGNGFSAMSGGASSGAGRNTAYGQDHGLEQSFPDFGSRLPGAEKDPLDTLLLGGDEIFRDAEPADIASQATQADAKDGPRDPFARISENQALAARLGNGQTPDGERAALNANMLSMHHEALLMHLASATVSLNIAFGDIQADTEKVMMYDASGDFLGESELDAAPRTVELDTLDGDELFIPARTCLVAPESDSLTIHPVTVPVEPHAWEGGESKLSSGSSAEQDRYLITDTENELISAVSWAEALKPEEMRLSKGELIYGSHEDGTIYGSEGNDTIFGGPGNEVIFAGGGDNEIWGGEGADTFAWDQASLAPGKDKIMDFSTIEGDRISFSQLLDHGDCLDKFLDSHIANAVVASHEDVMSFTIQGTGAVREVAIHFTERQTVDFGNMVLQYTAAGVQDQEEIALQLLKSICE